MENLYEKSLVALRTVYVGIKSEGGGIECVQMTEKLINYSRMSRTRYSLALEGGNFERGDAIKEKSAKRKVLDQIKSLKPKKRLTVY